MVFIAVQGAGKGTVAQKLQERHNLVHISMGDLLRERRQIDDEIGNIIASTQDIGEFTPDNIIYQVIEERLSQPDCERGYILDGFPRTLEQAKECEAIANRLNKPVNLVINLTVPEEALIERITSRRSCGKCNKIYSLSFEKMKPVVAGKCDACNSELVFRNDDKDVDAIRKRIELYHTNAKSLIDFYNDLGKLVEVDATETIPAVLEIEKLL